MITQRFIILLYINHTLLLFCMFVMFLHPLCQLLFALCAHGDTKTSGSGPKGQQILAFKS